jgi:hypothetical protein
MGGGLMVLWQAFSDGVPFEHPSSSGTLRARQAADLVVTSGHLLAGDGLISDLGITFARTVPLGRYPVILTVAEYSQGDQRVAYARIQLQPGRRPDRWEMATSATQVLSTLQEDEIFGYPVDSGTGCFMDIDAQRALATMTESELDDFTKRFIDRVHTWGWVDFTLDPKSGANIVAFPSGVGDGFYASYWGFDTNDDAVCLVTDFGLMDAE